MGFPILFLIFFNNSTRILFLILLILATLLEFFVLHYKPISKYLVALLISLAAALGLSFVSYEGLASSIIVILGCLATILLLADLLFSSIVSRTTSSAWLYALVYTSVPLCCLLIFHDQPYFKALLIGSLFLVWISDISAYVVGKSIGKNKLMPTISPGKTREGFFGAGMITILCSYFIYNVFGQFSMREWAIIALLVWLIGSAGDLVESKMKRQLNIKDSSNIFPGHGGFLDRFDGFIFCLPAVSAFVYFISK